MTCPILRNPSIQWPLSLGYMAYVICSAFADKTLLGHPQGIQYLTSAYNAEPIFYVMNGTLLLILATVLCDWRIFVLNKRIRERSASGLGASVKMPLLILLSCEI
jgi:hypothetical protein